MTTVGRRCGLPRTSTNRVAHPENAYPCRCEIMKVSGRMCHGRRGSSTRVPFARSSATIWRGMCPRHELPLRRSCCAPSSFARHWRSPATPCRVSGASGRLSVTTSWMCPPNSSRGMGPAISATRCDGAQTVTICAPHKCFLSMVPGPSGGTSVIVTANAHVPSRMRNSSAMEAACVFIFSLRETTARASGRRWRSRKGFPGLTWQRRREVD